MANSLKADVLLLAAGFGTRLRPLTDSIPKPLIKVGDKSLLEWNLLALYRSGCRRVFVNAHHLAPQITSFVATFTGVDIEIKIVYEPVILDTGGALRNIESELEYDNVIVINSDILLGDDFDFREVLLSHKRELLRGALATLVLRKNDNAEEFGMLGTDLDGSVVSFLGERFFRQASDCGTQDQKEEIAKYMFLGVSVWNKKSFSYMPQDRNVFSLTRDLLVAILRANKKVSSFIYRGYWSDVGTFDRLKEACMRVEG